MNQIFHPIFHLSLLSLVRIFCLRACKSYAFCCKIGHTNVLIIKIFCFMYLSISIESLVETVLRYGFDYFSYGFPSIRVLNLRCMLLNI